jgi:hypothetical protein
LVSIERVMHDGTCAGADSFRRKERVAAHLEAARQQVQAMGDPGADESARQAAAAARTAPFAVSQGCGRRAGLPDCAN